MVVVPLAEDSDLNPPNYSKFLWLHEAAHETILKKVLLGFSKVPLGFIKVELGFRKIPLGFSKVPLGFKPHLDSAESHCERVKVA